MRVARMTAERRQLPWLAWGLGLGLVGCVSSEKYEALATKYQHTLDAKTSLDREYVDMRQELAVIEQSHGRLAGQVSAVQDMVENTIKADLAPVQMDVKNAEASLRKDLLGLQQRASELNGVLAATKESAAQLQRRHDDLVTRVDSLDARLLRLEDVSPGQMCDAAMPSKSPAKGKVGPGPRAGGAMTRAAERAAPAGPGKAGRGGPTTSKRPVARPVAPAAGAPTDPSQGSSPQLIEVRPLPGNGERQVRDTAAGRSRTGSAGTDAGSRSSSSDRRDQPVSAPLVQSERGAPGDGGGPPISRGGGNAAARPMPPGSPGPIMPPRPTPEPKPAPDVAPQPGVPSDGLQPSPLLRKPASGPPP